MNATRRARIDEALKKLNEVQDAWNSALEILQECLDEEQDYYDNMPDGLKDSMRGEAASEAIAHLEEAINTMESTDLDEILSNVEIAKE